MKKSIKTSLIIFALAVLACLVCLVWLVSRSDESGASSVSNTSRGPSFEVNVEKPRMDRFLGGILPIKIEGKLLGGELRFDHVSPGARIGSVGPNRVEFSANGWDLLIETDGEGRVTPGTRLVFPNRDRGETVDTALPTRRSVCSSAEEVACGSAAFRAERLCLSEASSFLFEAMPPLPPGGVASPSNHASERRSLSARKAAEPHKDITSESATLHAGAGARL